MTFAASIEANWHPPSIAPTLILFKVSNVSLSRSVGSLKNDAINDYPFSFYYFYDENWDYFASLSHYLVDVSSIHKIIKKSYCCSSLSTYIASHNNIGGNRKRIP